MFTHAALTESFVLIIEIECVYCAVRTEFLNKIKLNLRFFFWLEFSPLYT